MVHNVQYADVSQKIILIRRKATDIKYKFDFYLYLYSFFKKGFILFLFVCVCVCALVKVLEPTEARGGYAFYRVRVTSGCESPNIGARN